MSKFDWIKPFDLNNLNVTTPGRPNTHVCIIGKKATAKTTLVKDIIKSLGWLKLDGIIVSPKEEYTNEYKQFLSLNMKSTENTDN